MNVIIQNLPLSILFVLRRSLNFPCSAFEWMLTKLDSCVSRGGGWEVGVGAPSLGRPLSHVKTHCPPAPFPGTTHPPYQPAEERAGACVQMNQRCLLYCFRLELFQVAYLREPQIMCSKLTLIISDPGERRALSLHTIKAMELAWRTCFSVNRGSPSAYKK